MVQPKQLQVTQVIGLQCNFFIDILLIKCISKRNMSEEALFKVNPLKKMELPVGNLVVMMEVLLSCTLLY